MGLYGDSIQTWDEMKKVFLKKYQYYYKGRELKEEIFKMTQKQDESLEDYMERFQYNFQISKQSLLSKETIRIIMLKGIRDECLEFLNMMGLGDVSKLSYDEVCDLCK